MVSSLGRYRGQYTQVYETVCVCCSCFGCSSPKSSCVAFFRLFIFISEILGLILLVSVLSRRPFSHGIKAVNWKKGEGIKIGYNWFFGICLEESYFHSGNTSVCTCCTSLLTFYVIFVIYVSSNIYLIWKVLY